nr:hypothetical protein [Enterocloster clostridioformis]
MEPVHRKTVRVHGIHRKTVSKPCRHHPAMGQRGCEKTATPTRERDYSVKEDETV